MNETPRVAVIIPALNEAASIANVLTHIPQRYRTYVIVADNGSIDGTPEIAKKEGAIVVPAPQQGYGAACLAGIEHAKKLKPEIYIFLDADFSDYPEDMDVLVDELLAKNLDMVIGSRNLGGAESGSLLPQARFGNWLATKLIHLRFGHLYTDLGPFRAIRAQALYDLDMKDTNFGWTVEMQVKAIKNKLKVGEVSVRYRKRIGVSKITGTVSGTVKAGIKILWTIGKYGLLNA